MKFTNKWMSFGVMVVGLICNRVSLQAQPTDDDPILIQDESIPIQDEPTPIQDESIVAEAEKPWNQGISIENRQAAKELFLEGNRLFKIPLFAKAAEQYAAALAQWKHPAFHFNRALALLNLGKEVEARESFELALLFGEQPLGADRLQEAQKKLRELERQLGRIRVSCQIQGAEVTLDGVTLFIGPGSYRGWVQAKNYELTAKKAGYLSEARRVTISSGGFQDIELRLVTLSQATDASRRWAGWKPWIVVTAGGAIAAAAGGLHAFAYRNFKIYDEKFQELECAEGPRSIGCNEDEIKPDLNERLSRARRQQAIASVGYITGGSVIAASILLLYLNRPRLTEQGASNSLGGSVVVLPAMSGEMLGIQVSVSP